MKYIIVGRSGTGKTALAEELERLGLMRFKTSTTRSKRNPDENDYIFVTKEDAAKITNKIAPNELNGNLYFMDQNQYEKLDPDFIILEPNGVKALVEQYPDTCFQIVHLYTKDDVKRLDKTQDIDEKRHENENETFMAFEENIKKQEDGVALADNARTVHSIANDYQAATIRMFAQHLLRNHYIFSNLTTIVNQCVDLGIINSDTPMMVTIYDNDEKKDQPVVSKISTDCFVELLLSDSDGLQRLIEAWLSHPLSLKNAIEHV